MQLVGTQTIRADRTVVWNALSNPTILAKCIEGCDYLNQVGPHQFSGLVKAKVGPIRASFRGEIQLSDIVPEERYTLSGEGKGGVAGFAKGSAHVQLADSPEGTALSYAVEAQVGGKMAQLGARLIDATAQSYAQSFFERFRAIVEDPVQLAAAIAEDEARKTQSATEGGQITALPEQTKAPGDAETLTPSKDANEDAEPAAQSIAMPLDAASLATSALGNAGPEGDTHIPGQQAAPGWLAIIGAIALAALAIWLLQQA